MDEGQKFEGNCDGKRWEVGGRAKQGRLLVADLGELGGLGRLEGSAVMVPDGTTDEEAVDLARRPDKFVREPTCASRDSPRTCASDSSQCILSRTLVALSQSLSNVMLVIMSITLS
jgi:hypothetical protein